MRFYGGVDVAGANLRPIEPQIPQVRVEGLGRLKGFPASSPVVQDVLRAMLERNRAHERIEGQCAGQLREAVYVPLRVNCIEECHECPNTV